VVLNCECNVLSGVRRPKPNAVILLAHKDTDKNMMIACKPLSQDGPGF